MFDKIVKALLPSDHHFYDLFDESAQNIVEAGNLLKKLFLTKTATERDKIVTQISVLEHQGDSVTHRIFSELNSTFVTPFDREDIHMLTSRLDDIMDHIDGSAGRVSLYKLTKFPESMIRLTDILHLSIDEVQKAVRLLRDFEQGDQFQKVFKTVNEYENEADKIFERAIADLFEKEKNAIQVIKLKEIYQGLETATDMCEDVANVLEGIYIKHS
jgi:hypothetical protein